MFEYRNADSDIARSSSSQVRSATASNKAIKKLGKQVGKLALKGARRGILIMGVALILVLIIVVAGFFVFFLDFEARGYHLEYANEYSRGNKVAISETGGRPVLLSMSEENRLVNNYYKLMSLQSFYKKIDGKVISLADDPDKFASVYDYYDKENLYYLSHNFLIAADEQMHRSEFRYPEQFIRPVSYDESTMTLRHLTDEHENLIAKSMEYGENGLPTGRTTEGVWDYGFAPILTYSEYTRHETIKGKYTKKEVCTVDGGVKVVPATGEFAVDIPGSHERIHVIDKVVSLSGEIRYDYREESLYYKPLLEGKTDNPAEPLTWVKYAECPGHEITKMVDGREVTETVNHGALYMYRGEGGVYETLPVEVSADTNLYGDRYLRDYFGHYKTFVPETAMEDFGFDKRSEADWELLKRLDALNVFGNYEDPIRANFDIGAMVDSDAYINALSYLPYFEEYGNMFDVDPALLMAIAAWESEGTHSDKGSSDGFGIMGLEGAGSTLKEIVATNKNGSKETMKIADNSSISSVVMNIKAGTMLLKSYLDRFNGNLLMALQAYDNGEIPVLQSVNKYVQGTQKTMGDVMADVSDIGWMENRSTFSGSRDPFYVEHVLCYYSSDSSDFDVVEASKTLNASEEKSMFKKVLSAVGGDIASLFGAATEIFANDYAEDTPRIGIENYATDSDLRTIIAMSISFDNQVSFSDAEGYLNNEDSGDNGYRIGFIHLGSKDYMGYFGDYEFSTSTTAALLEGFVDPISYNNEIRYRITSTFTNGRIRDDVSTGRPHNGVDIAMEQGTPLYAAGAGTVIKAGWLDASAGIGVVIQHDDGIITQYYHMSSTAVPRGVRVEKGTLIGRSGNTGFSTGPHLHFGVRILNQYVDPLDYFFRNLL